MTRYQPGSTSTKIRTINISTTASARRPRRVGKVRSPSRSRRYTTRTASIPVIVNAISDTAPIVTSS